MNEPTAIGRKDKVLRKTTTFPAVVRVLFEARPWLIWQPQQPHLPTVWLLLIPHYSFWLRVLPAPTTTVCE
ncbi:MAG: hypothetical protein ABSG78_21930 [Verrucomicrobiota bacterium]